jgi:hypothetical protein
MPQISDHERKETNVGATLNCLGLELEGLKNNQVLEGSAGSCRRLASFELSR